MPGQLPAGTRPDRRGQAARQINLAREAAQTPPLPADMSALLAWMGRELRENYVFILISHRKHGQNVVGPRLFPFRQCKMPANTV
jgi:hypothetical protein